ncbi:MAG: hypothetical protein M3N95_05335 [Actinomycetota bacterium]|nr:hypothetical protein [Actinomycetota bacterium]
MATTTPTLTSADEPRKAAAKPGVTQRLGTTAAALREQRVRLIQLALFAAGAALMPLGMVAIGLGWYGTAHTHYDYDQRTYLISGGIMGLGLTFVGGFLYFGAWLAKIANDQRDSSRQLSEALVLVAGLVSQQAERISGGSAAMDGAEPVTARDGTTVHRRDCPLIATRTDLHPLTGRETGLTTCRVCRPSTI